MCIPHSELIVLVRPSCNREKSANTNSRTEAALRIWNEANDARTTLAENYLHSRGLILPAEALRDSVL